VLMNGQTQGRRPPSGWRRISSCFKEGELIGGFFALKEVKECEASLNYNLKVSDKDLLLAEQFRDRNLEESATLKTHTDACPPTSIIAHLEKTVETKTYCTSTKSSKKTTKGCKTKKTARGRLDQVRTLTDLGFCIRG